MKFNITRLINKYSIVLFLVLLIVVVYSFSNIYEGVSNIDPSSSPSKEQCGEFTTANRELTHTLTNTTIDKSLASIMTEISDCETLVQEINKMLPMNINNIQVGSITQSEEGNEEPYFKIVVTPPPVTNSPSVSTPKNSSNSPSGNQSMLQQMMTTLEDDFSGFPQGATWTIHANLPAGLEGTTGPQGPDGKNGLPGAIGPQGPAGPRGKPGKYSFNEPFLPN
jgi:hypothetical protein